MFFTQEDYRKIEKWFLANSRKDTDFVGAATPLKGNETVVLVQNGKNVKTSVKDIVDQFFLLGVSDFLNITDKYGESYISIDQAIQLIPFRNRKEGQVITFLNTEGNWEIYQFIGKLNQWNNPTLWNNPFDWEKFIIDSILPDEEDLTKSLPDENGNAYLSLKDREYNPEDFSGLGRVILRKNIVEIDDPIYGKVTKNILFQDMIAQSNTIYEIRYDFDLNGQEITIPENCVLQFEGGNFSNGSLVFVNSSIFAPNIKLFNNISISGSLLNILNIYWFGAKGNGITDDTDSFKTAFSFNLPVLIDYGKFVISDTINATSDIECRGVIINKLTSDNIPVFDIKKYSEWKECVNVVGLNIKREDTSFVGHGIWAHASVNLINCKVSYCNYGICVLGYTQTIFNCRSLLNKCNLGISAGNKDISGSYEEVNDINIIGGNYSNAQDTYNGYILGIKIGKCPWNNNTTPNTAEGFRIKITGVALDNCSLGIDAIYQCELDNLYFEGPDDSAAIIIGVENETFALENISIHHCYISGCKIGILINKRVKQLDIYNISHRKITDIVIKCLDINTYGEIKNIRAINSTPNCIFYKKLSSLSVNDALSVYNNLKYNYSDSYSRGEVIDDSQQNYRIIGSGLRWLKTKKTIEGSLSDKTFTANNANDTKGLYPGLMVSSTSFIIDIDYENGIIKLNTTTELEDNILNILSSDGQAIRMNTTPELVDKKATGDIMYDWSTNEIIAFDGSTWLSAAGTSRKTYGTSGERPGASLKKGSSFFDTTLKNMLFWNGTTWIHPNGLKAYLIKGTTSQRPTLSETDESFEYYDSTLKKKILWNGTEWVNVDGTALT